MTGAGPAGKHPQALKGIQRGLERETLRVNADGTLATTGHPEALGSALTHKMDYYRFCGSIAGIYYTSGW
ncbi:hypothetical protein DMI69_20850 [Escherichia coli]|nr:hypothetical protein [Escherichia coli]